MNLKTHSPVVLIAALLVSTQAAWAKPDRIQHIIIISLENHSFDNVFGTFPGAEGISKAGAAATQTDRNGKPYATLEIRDRHFPRGLPNTPFPIEKYVAADEKISDPIHRFYQEQQQINGGKMDRFAAVSNEGGLVMGYYETEKSGLWQYAKEYTLADHFFHAAFGGSLLNHLWMVCACTPRFETIPDGMAAKIDDNGNLLKDGNVTPDGYVVNTAYPASGPRPRNIHPNTLLPPLEQPTIGDRLSEKNISWAWYSGGWNKAAAGKAEATFQYHHQPFVYFKNYAQGTRGRAEHLKDEADLLHDLKDGVLPAVVFYKPLGEFNMHPGYADMASGDEHVVEIIKTIEQSPVWKSSVVIVTFDENGGFWDHVAPPKIDRWGPGVRVPTIIISPFARKHYVDHTLYDTTSILTFIEKRFGLKPLAERDAKANDLANALEKP